MSAADMRDCGALPGTTKRRMMGTEACASAQPQNSANAACCGFLPTAGGNGSWSRASATVARDA